MLLLQLCDISTAEDEDVDDTVSSCLLVNAVLDGAVSNDFRCMSIQATHIHESASEMTVIVSGRTLNSHSLACAITMKSPQVITSWLHDC